MATLLDRARKLLAARLEQRKRAAQLNPLERAARIAYMAKLGERAPASQPCRRVAELMARACERQEFQHLA